MSKGIRWVFGNWKTKHHPQKTVKTYLQPVPAKIEVRFSVVKLPFIFKEKGKKAENTDFLK